jgi:septal ring factor EnvC (AmiA/AmiB activator)
MTLQRIEAQLADARKQLDRAIAQRDAAISGLIKSSDKIKAAQRTLARLEKRKREARTAEQAARKATAKQTAADGPLPAL